MSGQSGRLSKLQRWILAEVAKAPDGFFNRQEIFVGFFGLRRPYGDHGYKKARVAAVSISRSLKTLERKNFIKIRSGYQLTEEERRIHGFSSGDYSRIIGLTNEGKGKAESLNANSVTIGTELTIRTGKKKLNVNSSTIGPGVNNKETHLKGRP